MLTDSTEYGAPHAGTAIHLYSAGASAGGESTCHAENGCEGGAGSGSFATDGRLPCVFLGEGGPPAHEGKAGIPRHQSVSTKEPAHKASDHEGAPVLAPHISFPPFWETTHSLVPQLRWHGLWFPGVVALGQKSHGVLKAPKGLQLVPRLLGRGRGGPQTGQLPTTAFPSPLAQFRDKGMHQRTGA